MIKLLMAVTSLCCCLEVFWHLSVIMLDFSNVTLGCEDSKYFLTLGVSVLTNSAGRRPGAVTSEVCSVAHTAHNICATLTWATPVYRLALQLLHLLLVVVVVVVVLQLLLRLRALVPAHISRIIALVWDTGLCSTDQLC